MTVHLDETPTATSKLTLSVVLPVYNEAPILQKNLQICVDYLSKLGETWEMVLVDDGCFDGSSTILQEFAQEHPAVRVVRHDQNRGLAGALKSGISACRGDYVIVLDVDLSYSVDHIERLLAAIRDSTAAAVIASPYMPGGETVNVPFKRLALSRVANWFLRLVTPGSLHTFTGMVRAYNRRLLEGVEIKAASMDVNIELVYKLLLLRERVIEIPARLEWLDAEDTSSSGPTRSSSMRTVWHTLSTLFAGFIFRPFVFFLVPGLLCLLFSSYVNFYAFQHWWTAFSSLSDVAGFFPRASEAMRIAFSDFPHTFVVGGISSIFTFQLVSTGLLSMQNKRYFEELYHLSTAINKKAVANQKRDTT